MMEQYLEIKAANPGLLLFYRMGDFYELFFEDAEIASRALGIVLTKRGKHAGDDIPMCGVPVERAEDYLHRLIAPATASPSASRWRTRRRRRSAAARAWCKRDVVRVVTPGTLTEDNLLDARANNYLLAIARRAHRAAPTGWGWRGSTCPPSEFIVTECAGAELAAEHRPHQSERGDRRRRAVRRRGARTAAARTARSVTPLTRDVFDSATAERRLCDYFARRDHGRRSAR